MRNTIGKLIGVFSAIVIVSCITDSADVSYPANDEVAEAIYNSELQSIIENKCISCHIYHLEGDIRYDTYAKTKSSISQMMERINSTSNTIMPPADSAQLTDAEIDVFNEFLIALTSDSGADEDVEIEEEPVKINWTAYKYPNFYERAGVSGAFNNLEYSFNKEGESLVDILEDATITISASSVFVNDDVSGEKTINVGVFFEYFTPSIIGKVISYSEAEADVLFEMNGVSESVTLYVEVLEDTNQVILSGNIPDLAVFNWEVAHDAFQVICGGYHEGKLWPDVAIKATVNVDLL